MKAADFQVLSGDITDACSFQVELAARTFAASTLRMYRALGNHDLERGCERKRKHSQTVLALKSLPSRARKQAVDYANFCQQALVSEQRAAWIRAVERFRGGTYNRFEKHLGATRYVFLMLDNGYHGSDPGRKSRVPIQQDPISMTIHALAGCWRSNRISESVIDVARVCQPSAIETSIPIAAVK